MRAAAVRVWRRWAPGVAAVLLLCTACSTVVEGRFDAALLRPPAQAAPPAQPLPGHVVLRMQPAAADAVVVRESAPLAIRLPVGAITEGALRQALAALWQAGVQRGDAAPAPGRAATLVVEQVSASHRTDLHWLLPLPVYPFIIGHSDLMARLAFDLTLVDAQGRTVWRRSYDSGEQPYRPPAGWMPEPWPDGLLRMAHEQAWALAQQAAADVRAWAAAERMRERSL